MTLQLICSVGAAHTKGNMVAGHSTETVDTGTHTAVRSPQRPVSVLGPGASAARTRASSMYTPAAAPP